MRTLAFKSRVSKSVLSGTCSVQRGGCRRRTARRSYDRGHRPSADPGRPLSPAPPLTPHCEHSSLVGSDQDATAPWRRQDLVPSRVVIGRRQGIDKETNQQRQRTTDCSTHPHRPTHPQRTRGHIREADSAGTQKGLRIPRRPSQCRSFGPQLDGEGDTALRRARRGLPSKAACREDAVNLSPDPICLDVPSLFRVTNRRKL